MFGSTSATDAPAPSDAAGADGWPPAVPPQWVEGLPAWSVDPIDVPDLDADRDTSWDCPPIGPDPATMLALVTEADAPPPPWVSVADRAPGGWLALDLDQDCADPNLLTDAELIDGMVAFDHLASWAVARQTRLLAEFGRRRPGDDPRAINSTNPSVASRWAPDEVGLALHTSRGTAMVRLDQADRFTQVLSATLDLLESGRLDPVRARAICDAVAMLDNESATAVQARVLPRAPEQTVAQLRASLARAVLAADPRGAAERHRQARRQRRVRLTERDDGMASLWALLAAPDAIASYEWLSRLARSLGADDPRDMDARRADLLVDLLTGRLELVDAEPADAEPADASATDGTPADTSATDTSAADGPPSDVRPTDAAPTGPDRTDPDPADAESQNPNSADPGRAGGADSGGADSSGADSGGADLVPVGARPPGPAGPRPASAGKPLVHVVMPYSTLIGADDQPCELAGYGPIPADLAREIAADAVWKRLITDPLSGALLDHGRTTYRPPVALAEFVRARDGRCRSPICRRQAGNCELDHAVPWAEGGVTADHNLYTGCVHDHHLKHQPGWTVWMIRDGFVEWITPTGHHYISSPHDYRPENDPDPPLVRRTTAADPVPDRLTDPAAGRRPPAPPRARLSPRTMFGEPPDHPDPVAGDDPPPF